MAGKHPLSFGTSDDDGLVRVIVVSGGGGDLPAGAATEVKQDDGITELAAINAKLVTLAGYVDTLEALVAATNTAIGTTNGFVDGIEGLVTTLNSYVDGLEALVTSGNATATAIAGYVDGLETLVAATNTALSTIDGHVDGLEGVSGTAADAAVITDANGTISAKLRGLVVLVLAMSAKLPAALAASGGMKVEGVAGGVSQPVQAGGYTVSVSSEFTRPSDGTAYAIGDVVSNTGTAAVRDFSGCARAAGGSGTIFKATLITDQTTNVATYRLHLYNSAITAIADNSAHTELYANRAGYIGYIDFPAMATGGSDTAQSQQVYCLLPFVCGADSHLYGVLTTTAVFTPASAQKFFIQLGIGQD